MWDYQAQVTAVHDGDTIKVNIDLGFHMTLNGVWVRLDGINAPELLQSKDINGVPVTGELATLHVMKLLSSTLAFSPKRTRSYFGRPGDYLVAGAPIPCRITTRLEKGATDDFEKYGRVLGRVTVASPTGEDLDVNAAMLADGFAVPDAG